MTTKPSLETTLNDTQVLALLAALANTHPDYHHQVKHLNAALNTVALSTNEQITLAKDLLAAVAEDPQEAKRLAVLQQSTSTHSFDGGIGSATALAIIVFLLRTHIRFERQTDGKFKFKVEHKPVDNKLMKALLDKLKTILNC